MKKHFSLLLIALIATVSLTACATPVHAAALASRPQTAIAAQTTQIAQVPPIIQPTSTGQPDQTVQSPQTTPTPQPSKYDRVVTKAKGSWPWYIVRASGLVAAGLLTILIISGIGLITGHTYRVLEPVAAWAVHRALALALAACIVIHVLSLLLDKYQPYNILQVLIPFAAPYSKVTIAGVHFGSLYLAFGVIAMYVAAITIISSLKWMDSKPKFWRLLHYLNYLLVILIFFHGLFEGTDVKRGGLRFLWLLVGLVILVGIAMRISRAHTIDRSGK